MPNAVTLTGWKEFEDKCKGLPAVLTKEIGLEVEASAQFWASGAKRDAPVDQGFLRGLITSKKTGPMTAEATSPAEYSAYMEWGTKTRVKVPSELQACAEEFRSKGSIGAKKMIYAWMERVGIPKQFQFIVFLSIITKGIHPHPFFFVQMPKVEEYLKKNVQNILNTEH